MFLGKPRARNTNQTCAGRGHPGDAGQPASCAPREWQDAAAAVFSRLRAPASAKQAGRGRGGSCGGEEGHHLTPLIASQADILRRHREARIQGMGWFAAAALLGHPHLPLRGPCPPSSRFHPAPSCQGTERPSQAPLPGAEPAAPHGETALDSEGSRTFPGQTLVSAFGAAWLHPGEVYEPRALKPPSSQVGLFNPAVSTRQ